MLNRRVTSYISQYDKLLAQKDISQYDKLLAQKDAEISQLKTQKETEIAKLQAQVTALTNTVDELRKGREGLNFNPLLLEATIKGNEQQMRFALKGGANIKTRDEEGQSVLHLALHHHHREITEFLLNRYPSLVGTKDDKGYTVLHLAGKDSSLNEFIWLYTKVKGLPDFIETAEMFDGLYAVAREETRVFLLNNRLLEAASTGDIEVVKDALLKGVDLNFQGDDGETALYKAVALQRYAMVSFLLQQGADPTLRYAHSASFLKEDKTPLKLALEKKDSNMIEVIATSYLIHAASHGNQQDILFALDVGAKLQGVDANGQMALHKAVKKSDTVIIELLLQQHAEKNIDIYIKDKENQTPFDLALQLEQKMAINLAEAFGKYKFIAEENKKLKDSSLLLSQSPHSFMTSLEKMPSKRLSEEKTAPNFKLNT